MTGIHRGLVTVAALLAAGLAAAAPWDVEPAFKDEYTSDRLRYQVWTWRPSVGR